MEGNQTGAAKAAPVAASGDSQGDDLTRITGIGPAVAQALNREGIHSFAQLSDLNGDEAERLEERLGPHLKGRIKGQQWREQARDEAQKQTQKQAALAAIKMPPPNPREMQDLEAAPSMTGQTGQAFTAPDGVDNAVDGRDDRIASLERQVQALLSMANAAGDSPARRRQQRAAGASRHAKIMLMASEDEDQVRHRLNPHRKFSEILGSDDALPPGAIFQQVVTEDGEKRVAYFANDRIQRYLRDEDTDVIDLDNVEPEHEATIENVNFRHYLDGRVDYPPALLLEAMKERFGFEGRSMGEAKGELHRIIRQNRA